MDNESPISILNHDCLLEIFQNFNLKELAVLADVSQCFRDTAHRAFAVTHHRCINLPIDCEYEVNVDTATLILEHFGDEVTDLRISFPVDPDFHFNLDIYSDLRLAIIAAIARCVGESLHKLSLENLQVFDFNTRTVNNLQGILSRIRVLKLSTFDRDATPCYLDFRTLCPMMEKLKLAGDFIIDAVEYPNLTNFTIQRNRLLDTDANEDMLPSFYAANPQLRKLKIKAMNYGNALLDLHAANWNDLEKFSVECYNLHANNFHLLLRMPNLVKLKLFGIYALENLEQTMHIVSRLGKLKHLQLSMTPRYNPVISENDLLLIAHNVRGLESLLICLGKLTATAVVRFVEVATHLRKFNCAATGLKIDVQLCQRIVEARQRSRADHALELCGDCCLADRAAVREVNQFSILIYSMYA